MLWYARINFKILFICLSVSLILYFYYLTPIISIVCEVENRSNSNIIDSIDLLVVSFFSIIYFIPSIILGYQCQKYCITNLATFIIINSIIYISFGYEYIMNDIKFYLFILLVGIFVCAPAFLFGRYLMKINIVYN